MPSATVEGKWGRGQRVWENPAIKMLNMDKSPEIVPLKYGTRFQELAIRFYSSYT